MANTSVGNDFSDIQAPFSHGERAPTHPQSQAWSHYDHAVASVIALKSAPAAVPTDISAHSISSDGEFDDGLCSAVSSTVSLAVMPPYTLRLLSFTIAFLTVFAVHLHIASLSLLVRRDVANYPMPAAFPGFSLRNSSLPSSSAANKLTGFAVAAAALPRSSLQQEQQEQQQLSLIQCTSGGQNDASSTAATFTRRVPAAGSPAMIHPCTYPGGFTPRFNPPLSAASAPSWNLQKASSWWLPPAASPLLKTSAAGVSVRRTPSTSSRQVHSIFASFLSEVLAAPSPLPDDMPFAEDLVIALHLLLQAAGCLLYGAASDMKGRKWVFSHALKVLCCATFIFPLAVRWIVEITVRDNQQLQQVTLQTRSGESETPATPFQLLRSGTGARVLHVQEKQPTVTNSSKRTFFVSTNGPSYYDWASALLSQFTLQLRELLQPLAFSSSIAGPLLVAAALLAFFAAAVACGGLVVAAHCLCLEAAAPFKLSTPSQGGARVVIASNSSFHSKPSKTPTPNPDSERAIARELTCCSNCSSRDGGAAPTDPGCALMPPQNSASPSSQLQVPLLANTREYKPIDDDHAVVFTSESAQPAPPNLGELLRTYCQQSILRLSLLRSAGTVVLSRLPISRISFSASPYIPIVYIVAVQIAAHLVLPLVMGLLLQSYQISAASAGSTGAPVFLFSLAFSLSLPICCVLLFLTECFLTENPYFLHQRQLLRHRLLFVLQKASPSCSSCACAAPCNGTSTRGNSTSSNSSCNSGTSLINLCWGTMKGAVFAKRGIPSGGVGSPFNKLTCCTSQHASPCTPAAGATLRNKATEGLGQLQSSLFCRSALLPALSTVHPEQHTVLSSRGGTRSESVTFTSREQLHRWGNGSSSEHTGNDGAEGNVVFGEGALSARSSRDALSEDPPEGELQPAPAEAILRRSGARYCRGFCALCCCCTNSSVEGGDGIFTAARISLSLYSQYLRFSHSTSLLGVTAPAALIGAAFYLRGIFRFLLLDCVVVEQQECTVTAVGNRDNDVGGTIAGITAKSITLENPKSVSPFFPNVSDYGLMLLFHLSTPVMFLRVCTALVPLFLLWLLPPKPLQMLGSIVSAFMSFGIAVSIAALAQNFPSLPPISAAKTASLLYEMVFCCCTCAPAFTSVLLPLQGFHTGVRGCAAAAAAACIRAAAAVAIVVLQIVFSFVPVSIPFEDVSMTTSSSERTCAVGTAVASTTVERGSRALENGTSTSKNAEINSSSDGSLSIGAVATGRTATSSDDPCSADAAVVAVVTCVFYVIAAALTLMYTTHVRLPLQPRTKHRTQQQEKRSKRSSSGKAGKCSGKGAPQRLLSQRWDTQWVEGAEQAVLVALDQLHLQQLQHTTADGEGSEDATPNTGEQEGNVRDID